MDHLTEAELQAWIDRELDQVERARVSRHLEDCPICRRLLGELRAAAETFSGAMLRYDEDLAAGTDRVPAERRSSAARRWPVRASRAAAVVLLLGAAAAAAMVPGSPFRALFTEPSAPAVDVVPEPNGAADSPAEAGASITVRPLDGRLTVKVTGFPAGTRVLLRLSDLPDAMASLPDGAANARFIVSSGTLEVVGPGEADDPSDGPLVLRLPRSLASGVVELEDTAVARVSDGRLITLRQVSRTGDEAVLEIGG